MNEYKISSQPSWSRGLLLIPKSYFNLNNNSRLHLHRKPIVPHDNLLKPPPGEALVKIGKLRIPLLNELVQLIDTLDLFVTDGCVDEVLLLHLTKLVYSYVRFSYPKQYSDIKMTLVTFKKTAYYIAIQQKKIIPTETSRDLHGGEEGIRTLVGLPPNGFQDRLVMTTSIPLRIVL